MTPWWWLILAGYGGVVIGFIIAAILNANDRRTIADEADEWLRRRTP